MLTRKTDQAYRSTILCVDSYENGIPVGRFYHPGLEEGCSFHSLSHFLMEMDRTMDELASPQSFTVLRTFGPCDHSPAMQVAASRVQEGRLGTFSIRILFRQNSSWQGSIRWLEGNQEQSFRSVLDLIFLLDSVLSRSVP